MLIGNADEMGDAGVSSSLMQLYLHRILECLLNGVDRQLESIAFEVAVIILEQGLVHPMLVRIVLIPLVIFLFTCSSSSSACRPS